MRYTDSGIHQGRLPLKIALRNHEPFFLAVVRGMSEPLTQEVCVCSRSHLLSSELDLLSYNAIAMWRNFGSLRAQLSRPPDPDPDPPLEKIKLKAEKDSEELVW